MKPEAGFTLIEALVAMAVLAVGAISLLGAVEGHTRRISDIEGRLAARWTAENRLTELRLGLPTETETTMLGATWSVTADGVPTGDAALDRVDIRVAATGGPQDGAVLSVLTGFVAAPEEIAQAEDVE